jgi:predicted nucleic acid-binding Zn ribbon protein
VKRRRRKTTPQPIGAMLGPVLADLGLEAAGAAFRILEIWDGVVGPEIAQHCRPVAVRRGVLEAEVDSSVWCQQLQMQRLELLAGLREALGAAAPSDLRFRVGYARRR